MCYEQRRPWPKPVVLSNRPWLPVFSMTVTNVTTPDSGINPEDDSSQETQLDVAGKTYDPMLNPELDEVRAMIAERGIKGESRIREAANKKSFPLALQY